MVKKTGMKKGELIELIKKLLKTDSNLDFLIKLEHEELEILVACIRNRMG